MKFGSSEILIFWEKYLNMLSQIISILRGQGGGSQFKKIFFLVVVHLIALNMGNQKLFTELKKLYLLLRYDPSKLGPTRAFSGFCIGNSQIFAIKNHLFFLSTFRVLMLQTQFFGYR